MVNHPRRAGPPLPRLSPPASGTASSKPGEAKAAVGDRPERSGTRPAVQREIAPVAAPPRPGALFEAFGGKTALRRNPLVARAAPVPRRQDEAAADESLSSEPFDEVPYRDSLPTIPAPEELESQLLAESRRRDSQRAGADAPEISVAGWSDFAARHPPARKSHPELECHDDNGLFPPPPKTGFGTLRTLKNPGPSANANDGEAVAEDQVDESAGAPSLHRPGSASVIVSDPLPPPSVASSPDVPEAALEPASSELLDTIPPTRRAARKGTSSRLGSWLLTTTLLAAVVGGAWSLFPERSLHTWRMLETWADVWWRGAGEWLERVPR